MFDTLRKAVGMTTNATRQRMEAKRARRSHRLRGRAQFSGHLQAANAWADRQKAGHDAWCDATGLRFPVRLDVANRRPKR